MSTNTVVLRSSVVSRSWGNAATRIVIATWFLFLAIPLLEEISRLIPRLAADLHQFARVSLCIPHVKLPTS